MMQARQEPIAAPAEPELVEDGETQGGARPGSIPSPLPLPPRVAARRPAVARRIERIEPAEHREPRPSWPSPPAEPTAPLPLRMPVRPAPAPVQRVETAAAGTDAQPAEPTSKTAEESPEAEGPNLEELARKVYPYLRRRLGVERERIGRR